MEINPRLFSIENIYLFDVLRCFIAGKISPQIPANLNWVELEKILKRHKLIPIFNFMLNSSQISKEQMDRWKAYSINELSKYCHRIKSTVELFRIFDAENIPAVALRGIALAEWIYPEPSLRPMRDVDLLIRSDKRYHIVDKFKKYGLAPYKINRSQFVYNIDSNIFELHWALLTSKRYGNCGNFDQWLTTRHSVKTNEGKIYCLKPEDELLELIFHVFIHHDLDRILQLLDVALLLSKTEMDWDYLSIWCRDASMTRLFCFTLAFVDYLFDINLKQYLCRFDGSFPKQLAEVFEAYTLYFFKKDTLANFIRRKKNILFVAEQPMRQFKQLLRFVNADEILNFSMLFLNSVKGRL